VTDEVGQFLQGRAKSASFLEQKLSHGAIFSQADRSVVSVLGFTAPAKEL
jgi:hypothetical protein